MLNQIEKIKNIMKNEKYCQYETNQDITINMKNFKNHDSIDNIIKIVDHIINANINIMLNLEEIEKNYVEDFLNKLYEFMYSKYLKNYIDKKICVHLNLSDTYLNIGCQKTSLNKYQPWEVDVNIYRLVYGSRE